MAAPRDPKILITEKNDDPDKDYTYVMLIDRGDMYKLTRFKWYIDEREGRGFGELKAAMDHGRDMGFIQPIKVVK